MSYLKGRPRFLTITFMLIMLLCSTVASVGVSSAVAKCIEIPPQAEELKSGMYQGRHMFKLEVQAGDSLRVFVPSDGDYVYMILYAPSGCEIRRGQNVEGPGTKVLVYTFPNEDTWYLEVYEKFWADVWTDPENLPTEYELQVNMTTEIDEVVEEAKQEVESTSIQLVNEQITVYSIKELDPTIKFEIRGIGRNSITPGPHGLRFFADLTVSGKNDLNEWEIGPSKCVFKPMAVQTRYKWTDEQTLIFEVPLYEVLRDNMGIEPCGFLATNHFGSNPDSDIPGEMTVTLTLNPLELLVTQYDQAERELEHDSDMTESTFLFGSEINLEKDSKLKTGDPHPSSWHDYPDVVLCVLKVVTGVEGMLDYIDAGIQIYGGEYLDAVIGLISPSSIELLFAFPEIVNIVEEFFPVAPESVIRDTESALRNLGYTPISGFQVTKDFPIWVNLTDGKFALIDPTGIVHKVNSPGNFHIGYPYFTLEGTSPSRHYVSYAIQDNEGTFTDWVSGSPDTTSIPIVPPPKPFQPVRVILSTEVNTVYGQGNVPAASELRIQMRSLLPNDRGQGELILRDLGVKGDGLMGMLDLGWRHEKTEERILEDPYACLISGELYVNDVQSTMIGVGYYERVQGAMTSIVPKVWCEPNGTEYVIKMTPEEEHDFQVTVMQGSVDLLDANGSLIDSVASGESKDLMFPDISTGSSPGSNAAIVIVPVALIATIIALVFVLVRRKRGKLVPAYVASVPSISQPLPPTSIATNCDKCGAEAQSGAIFCGKCGATLPPEIHQISGTESLFDLSCHSRGSQTQLGEKYCGKCGASLSCSTQHQPSAEHLPSSHEVGISTPVTGQLPSTAAEPDLESIAYQGTVNGKRGSLVLANVGALLVAVAVLISLTYPWYKLFVICRPGITDCAEDVSAIDMLTNSPFWEPIWALNSLPIILIIVFSSFTILCSLYGLVKKTKTGWLWAILGFLLLVCVVTNAWYFLWEEQHSIHSQSEMISPGCVVAGISSLVLMFSGIIGRQKQHRQIETQNHQVSGAAMIEKGFDQSPPDAVCPGCHSYVLDEWRVCPHCGEALVEVVGYSCSKCGKDVEDDWKVCPYCGESLDNVE